MISYHQFPAFASAQNFSVCEPSNGSQDDSIKGEKRHARNREAVPQPDVIAPLEDRKGLNGEAAPQPDVIASPEEKKVLDGDPSSGFAFRDASAELRYRYNLSHSSCPGQRAPTVSSTQQPSNLVGTVGGTLRPDIRGEQQPRVTRKIQGLFPGEVTRLQNMRKPINFRFLPVARRNVNKHIVRWILSHYKEVEEDYLRECKQRQIDTSGTIWAVLTLYILQEKESNKEKLPYARIIDWLLTTPFRRVLFKHCLLNSLSDKPDERLRDTNIDVYINTKEDYLNYIDSSLPPIAHLPNA